MRKFSLGVAACALLAAVPASVEAAADPFYLSVLRDGIHAYDSGDYAAASHDFKLACFGMLDEPTTLVDCLARLALAQDKAGDVEAFRDTFRRIVEVEERFSAYTKAQLSPELKNALELRVIALVPAPTLTAVPVFQPLAARKAAALAQADPKAGRGRGRGARSSEPPAQQAATPAPPPAPAAAAPSTAAPAPAAPAISNTALSAPKPAPAGPAAGTAVPPLSPAPAPLSPAEQEKMATARLLLAGDGKVKELRQAFQLAREVADAHRDSSDAQHLAAEAAYRISRWGDAATYFRRGGEPGEDQPERLFYMAVALFESGDPQAAQTVMRRSLPNLQRTPYVDNYAKKILGGAGAP